MSQFINALLRTHANDFPSLAYWIAHDEPELGAKMMRQGLIMVHGEHAYWTPAAIDMRKDIIAGSRRGNQ